MLERFKLTLDSIRHHHPQSADNSNREDGRQASSDPEFRCWNCGEYIDAGSEMCPYCGHSPDPVTTDFNKKRDE